MFRGFLLLIPAVALYGQNAADAFNKPPEEVDKALRERVSAFYQAHVDNKVRQAEEYVAEDTKDLFYNGNKPHYLSYEIESIAYNEDFTRAKVIVKCGQMLPFPGLMGRPMKLPTPSTWKVEKGKWMYWVDPESLRMTPFGKMTGGPPLPDDAPITMPSKVPTAAEMAFIFDGVKIDKQQVVLRARAGSSEQVNILNTLPGLVNIKLSGTVPGVEINLDRTELKGKETAVLTLRSKPGTPPTSAEIAVQVLQTRKDLTIKVVVK